MNHFVKLSRKSLVAKRTGAPPLSIRVVELEGSRLIRVTLRNGETAEKLVQRFKRTVAKEGTLKEIKKRKYYEKPSEARRRRMREQEKLLRKKARKKALKDARRRAARRKHN